MHSIQVRHRIYYTSVVDAIHSLPSKTLAERTQGYSGAEVVAVCTEAALAAINDALDSNTPAQEAMIDIKDFGKALQIVKPRTDPKTIDFFEEYSRHN